MSDCIARRSMESPWHLWHTWPSWSFQWHARALVHVSRIPQVSNTTKPTLLPCCRSLLSQSKRACLESGSGANAARNAVFGEGNRHGDRERVKAGYFCRCCVALVRARARVRVTVCYIQRFYLVYLDRNKPRSIISARSTLREAPLVILH